jgi:DNA primase
MSIIDEIRAKTDIVEVIGQYTRLVKSGKTFKGLCPFHAEKHGSFFVYPDQQTWHCFGACGTGGDVFSFVMKRENLSFGEARNLMAARAGIVIPENTVQTHSRERNDRLYQINEMAADYYHQLLLKAPEAEKVRLYLANRHLDAGSVAEFKLGYSPNAWDNLQRYLAERGFESGEMLEAGLIMQPDGKSSHDRFRHRLMFPIADMRGRITGFGARALDDTPPKYLNSPQTPLFDKGGSLYALHLAREAMRKADQAVIVEGYMDVILAHQHGFKNVIACMGTAIGEKHCQTLKKITRRLVLALDADSAGEAATLRAVTLENSLEAEIRMTILPAGKDPDEIIIADPAAWSRHVEEAVPIMDFIFERTAAGLDMKTANGRNTAADKLLPVVDQMQNPVRQVSYINRLAEITGADKNDIVTRLRQNRVQAYAGRPMAAAAAPRKLTARPLEEYCLSLLLQHPELARQCQRLAAEYFVNSENREIFRAILATEPPADPRLLLDASLQDHCAGLVDKKVPGEQLENKLNEIILRLREERLKQQVRHAAEEPAPAESEELRQVFIEKDRLGMRKRRQSE